MNVERVTTVGIVVLRPPEVLLIKAGEASRHPTGTIGHPGGHPEPGETLEQTAKRELKEETGLDVKIEDLHEIPGYYDSSLPRKGGQIGHFHHKVFTTDKFEGELSGSDEAMPFWARIEALQDMTLMPYALEMTHDGMKALGYE